MKIAYIFRGHARTWDKCYENFFKNVFSIAPGDIFIHTWGSNNSLFGSHWNGCMPLNEEQLKISSAAPDFNKIYDIYKPKAFIVEPDKSKDIKAESDIMASHMGLQYMLNSSKKLYNEIINHYDYDYVFETRLDINYTSKLDLTEFDSKNLMCPVINNLLFDFWMFGSVDNMKIKIDFFENIKSYWYDKGCTTLYYEHALQNYLRDKGISWLNSSLMFDVPRLF
jgi:hypothetical protein